jgi:nucleoside-diphosphate-sugar epimerase
MTSIAILGCGWLGFPVARGLINKGYCVSGSTTTETKHPILRDHGIIPYTIDLVKGVAPKDFFQASIMIVAIPPRIHSVGRDGYFNQLSFLVHRLTGGNVKHVVFISSTSVYNDLNRIVTEKDAEPDSIMINAENIFRAQERFITTVIRFAGLVGPGRHPGRFLSGKLVSSPEAPVNVIHLDDCVEILMTIITTGVGAGLTMNACSDLHPAKRLFYNHAAFIAQLPPPIFTEEGSDGFKIVDNSLLKKTLDYNFRHPDPMRMFEYSNDFFNE